MDYQGYSELKDMPFIKNAYPDLSRWEWASEWKNARCSNSSLTDHTNRYIYKIKTVVNGKKGYFALKVINCQFNSFNDQIKEIINYHEIQSKHNLPYKNIIKYVHYYVNEPYIFIIMPFYKTFTPGIRMGMKELIKYAYDILNALIICHSNHIVHRDVKPANTFYDDIKKCYVLGDLGSSKQLIRSSSLISSTVGTAPYRDENTNYNPYNLHLSDLYALAVSLIELRYGRIIKDKNKREIDDFNQILDKALDENLDDRFQTAKEMLDVIIKFAIDKGYFHEVKEIEEDDRIPSNPAPKYISDDEIEFAGPLGKRLIWKVIPGNENDDYVKVILKNFNQYEVVFRKNLFCKYSDIKYIDLSIQQEQSNNIKNGFDWFKKEYLNQLRDYIDDVGEYGDIKMNLLSISDLNFDFSKIVDSINEGVIWLAEQGYNANYKKVLKCDNERWLLDENGYSIDHKAYAIPVIKLKKAKIIKIEK